MRPIDVNARGGQMKKYVVFCESDNTYWCGLNTWDKQLRKAKIFHSLKYIEEVYKRHKQLKLKTLEVRIEVVPDQPTNADHIRSMNNEGLAAIFCYFLTSTLRVSGINATLGDSFQESFAEWLAEPYKENADG